MAKDTPYFLWDYDLSEAGVQRVLRTGTQTGRIWLLSRILGSAQFQDVWKYTTLKQVREIFPNLKLKKPVRQAWQHALELWAH